MLLYDKVIINAIKAVLNTLFAKHLDLKILPCNRYFHRFNHGFYLKKNYQTALNLTTA